MAHPRRAARTSAGNAAGSKSQSTLSFRATKAGAHTGPVGKADAVSATSPPLKKARLSDVEVANQVNASEEAEIKREEEQIEQIVTPPQARAAASDVNPNLEAIKAESVSHTAEVKDEESEDEDEELAAQYAAARKLPAAAIKRYWNQKESGRRAARVHQKSLSLHEKLLREWDVASRWGPSVGINREARWRRAFELGLDPPVEVLAVLVQAELKHSSDLQISIVDELLASSGREGMAAQV